MKLKSYFSLTRQNFKTNERVYFTQKKTVERGGKNVLGQDLNLQSKWVSSCCLDYSVVACYTFSKTNLYPNIKFIRFIEYNTK